MRFTDLEKIVRKMQVMNNRADVSFKSIELETEKRIDFKRLWIVIDKGRSSFDCMTMHMHISRFDDDDVRIRTMITKIDDFKETVIYDKIVDIKTVSSASDFIECAIQAFIA